MSFPFQSHAQSFVLNLRCRYKYDVEEGTLAFGNRRTFAYADTGAADGSSKSLTPPLFLPLTDIIHLKQGLGTDTKGYVYGACGDGVHVSFLS